MFQLNLSHGKNLVTLLQFFVGLSVMKNLYGYVRGGKTTPQVVEKITYTPNFTQIFENKIEMTVQEFQAFVEEHASLQIIMGQSNLTTSPCFMFNKDGVVECPMGQLSRMLILRDNQIDYADQDYEDLDRLLVEHLRNKGFQGDGNQAIGYRLSVIAQALNNEKQIQYAINTDELGTCAEVSTASQVRGHKNSQPSLIKSFGHVVPCALGAAASAFIPNLPDTAKVLVSGIGAVASFATAYVLNRETAGASRA